jgi:hypothetical protein
MSEQASFDPFRTQDDPSRTPADLSASFDPFRTTDPPANVNEVEFDVFEGARGNRETRCPACESGTVEGRGVSPSNGRPWVRFTCGHVISHKQQGGN